MIIRGNSMVVQYRVVLPVCLFVIFWTAMSTGQFISNLNNACFACLCNVMSECNMTLDCNGGYCGPFFLSKVYWADAGMVTLPDDDPDDGGAWEDCAKDYPCAKRMISQYLQKYGKDCNGDGVTNCFDYLMINGNGGTDCNTPLNATDYGLIWLERYEGCRLYLE